MGIGCACGLNNKDETTFVVTGSNKGIGYGIVENLCKLPQIPNIIMACRN
jgi:NAD(P)-dependent dehydrogenase (short-subunit alcohol dehydrogenase family)